MTPSIFVRLSCRNSPPPTSLPSQALAARCPNAAATRSIIARASAISSSPAPVGTCARVSHSHSRAWAATARRKSCRCPAVGEPFVSPPPGDPPLLPPRACKTGTTLLAPSLSSPH